MYVSLLNKIWSSETDQNVEHVIKSRFIGKNDPRYPGNVLHIFAEKTPAKRHNDNWNGSH